MSSTIIFIDFETCICDYEAALFDKFIESHAHALPGSFQFSSRPRQALIDCIEGQKSKSYLKQLQSEVPFPQ